jgi:hypothetical protein
MEPDKKTEKDEQAVIQRQYIAFFVALVLFIPLGFLITMKYSMLVSIVVMSYISISSIMNRVSIIRPKGRLAHSRGNQAVIYGILMLIGAFFTMLIILLIPSEKFLPF